MGCALDMCHKEFKKMCVAETGCGRSTLRLIGCRPSSLPSHFYRRATSTATKGLFNLGV